MDIMGSDQNNNYMKLITLLLLVTLFSHALGGRILNGDLWVDYANAGSMTQLSFSFMLQNSIDQYDYIKAALPFPLHASLVPAYPATQGLSLPSGLTITYQYVDGSSNVQPTVYTCQALTETIDSSNYFIRFYDTDRKTLIPIPKNQWFYLKFKIQQTGPLEYQKSNSILQIQMSTVSSVWSNAMVYDDNLAFNYFELVSAPSQTLTLSATPYNFGTAGGYLLTQAEYDIYLDVSMDISEYQFEENLKLLFFIDVEDTFMWTGNCSSVAKTNAPTIQMLDSSLYTCSVDSTKNIMEVILNPSALTTQTSYRFTVQIVNPSIVVTDVDITVKAVKEVSGVILSEGVDTAALNTNQIYVTYQEIFVGWGLKPDALLPFDARVFRGDAATPSYMPYNSLSTKFSVSQTTSTSIELKIQINIPSESNAFVLTNGFTFNFPAFPDKQVQCVVENADDTVNRKISCTGVGSLVQGDVYEIGWKMFFPYDNYESDIDCTQFGLLTVYTAEMITEDDNGFILGRGNQFLNFLKSSPDYFVIGRNSSYIDYMKTFVNLNLIVISSDFQEFLKMPEQIIVTNRPTTFANKIFNDVYVIGQNLAFMTYLSLFDDLYIAYRLKDNSDITKGYHTTPIIATSMPKNTLTIKTANSKDWTDYSTNQNPLVSSTTATSGFVPGDGFRVQPSTDQSIIFSLKAPYGDVTSYGTTSGTVIDDNWSFQILMNPKIELNGAAVLSESTASLSVTAETVDASDAFNRYTLITLKGSLSDNIQTTFPTTATKTSFGIFPFRISDYSSISANDDNFDVMIATTDGIDGPLNQITHNGFFLINGFTMIQTAEKIGTLNSGFVAYGHSSQMDGSEVPTLLRLKGSVGSATNFDSLAIFFDKLTPFFSNYHNDDIYCHSSDGTPYCKFRKGAEEDTLIYNYQTFSRIQIPITDETTAFDIMIPITAEQGITHTYLYLGYLSKDPTSGKVSLAYIEPMRTITHSGSFSTNGVYGPDLTGFDVGQTISLMTLKANAPSGVSANSGDNLGAAFLYFSEWDYFGSSTISGWGNGPCYVMKYLLYQTNYDDYLSGSSFTYTYKAMKGVTCFADSGTAVTSAQLTVSQGYLPSKWGKILPGFGGYSSDIGRLYSRKANHYTILNALSVTNVSSIITPTMGPSLQDSIGKWQITLPVAIDDDVQIIMTGDLGTTNLPFTSSSGTCSIYLMTTKLPIGCIYTSSPTEVDYILTVHEEGLLPKSSVMSIVHYGLDTNSSYSTQDYDLKVYSLVYTTSPGANDLIFEALSLPFNYGGDDSSYIGPSEISLSGYSQKVNNKGAITDFQFNFNVQGKGLYVTNRVRVNLGHYYTDNSASLISPHCKIYTYNDVQSTMFSHDWSAVDSSQGLNMLQFWPQKDLINTNLTYNVKCKNFVATSSPSPTGISAMVVNTSSDLTGQISTTSSISLSVLTSLSQTNQVTVSKKYTIPSCRMQVQFAVTSPGVTTDSIMYIGFPSYYANGLGQDLKCYSTNEIFCSITDRLLTIRYMGTYEAGQAFTITVAGVSKPVNYNSGTFYFVIDNDDDPTTVLSSGTFTDSVTSSVLDTQNFPVFQILSFSQSSNYLREEGVIIMMDFYLPSTIPSITVGQELFLVFPPIFEDVLRFIDPTCTLNIRGNTLKNYISECYVRGLKLKMPFLDDVVLSTTYSLTVQGIINPTNPSSNTFKYALQISDSDDASVIAKTYSPHANFQMPVFIINPIRQSLNYYTVADGLVTQVTTTVNIQSDQVYISSGTDLNESSYSRNVYLSPLNNLYSIPSSIELNSGSNPFPIRFSALTSGINYIYFSKSGDGNFYSSLPPLILSTNKNYFTPVSMVETAFNLPVATVNTNYTIGVNLPPQLYPMSEVNLTVTISSLVGVSLRSNPTVIKFYPQKTSAEIDLYINDDTLWLLGTTTNLVLTPQDTTTYASAVSIPLTATAAVTSDPIAVVTVASTDLKEASFSISCSEYGRFVYHLSRKFPYNTTACSLTINQISYWIQQSSIDGLRVDETYYECEDVLGQENIDTPGVAQTLLIQNLATTTDYTLNGYCLSQIGSKSDLMSRSFSTTANGGYVSKLDFFFETELTTAEKIKLVCSLALQFQVNYYKVSTSDGYYCSELLSSRLLTESIHQRILQSSYRVSVYFGVNNELNEDLSPQFIYNSSMNETNITNQLANVVGLPSLISISEAAASYVGPNDMNSTRVFIDIGPTYAYVEGIVMPQNGIVYVIIGEDSLWSRAPTISEIKKGTGPNGLPPVYYKVLAYRTDEADTGYAAYTDVGDSKLNMYIMCSDDNPFDTANFGTIRKYELAAETPKWESHLIALGVLLALMLLV